MNFIRKHIIIIIIVIIILALISAILFALNKNKAKEVTPVVTDYVDIDDQVNQAKIKVYDQGNIAISLYSKMAWTQQEVKIGNDRTETLCGDSQDFGYLYDEEIIAGLSKVKDISKIEIIGKTEYLPNYSVYRLSDDFVDYSDDKLISSDTQLVLPSEDGEYLIVITIVWTEGNDKLYKKYYFKYIVKKEPAAGVGTILVYDENNKIIPVYSEHMWSMTLVTNNDGSKGYLCADAGQLGFQKKEELISGLTMTTSVKQVDITKEPWDGPYYTIYDAASEDINLVGASGESLVYYGNDLILPNEAGEYIIGISVVWEIDTGTSGYKYFFKYIVE